MSCVQPIDCWKARRLNASGKRGIVFSLRDGFQDMALQVPCGKCVGCAADKAREWSIRCYHESQLHDLNSFITLTYDDEHLPSDGLISKKHLQDFFKRLRHDCIFRYFACAEYGDLSRRPHYHAVIFGQDFRGGHIDLGGGLYTSPRLAEVWGKGVVSVGAVTPESIAYVCGYTAKKLGDSDTFTLMSRRPAIGSGWLDKYKDELRRNGQAIMNGHTYAVPKSYLVKEPDYFAQLKLDRASFFKHIGVDDRWLKRSQLPNLAVNYRSRNSLKSETI